jgi:predicted DNA binding protein
MSVVATFTVPGESCVVSRAAAAADVEVEMDRVVPLGGRITPLLWVAGDPRDCGVFADLLAAEGAVERVTELERMDGRRLYKLDWAGRPDGVVGQLLETDAAVLSAAGSGASFDFVIRFNSSDALSEFHERCRDSGVSLEVTGVRQRHETEEDGPGLTAQQRETLLRAYERGYYDVPRDVTAVDLAEEIGISDQSLSERLRRAHARLVEYALL